MQQSQWLELMTKIGIDKNLNTFNQLITSYNEKHRFYHNTEHISAVLRHFNQSKHLAKQPDTIEVSLWFHDAIYQPFSSSNERDSANWAVDFLINNGVDKIFYEQVYNLIMATLHNATPINHDEKLIVDIDLSILGSNPEIYNQFESWIRKEYKLVPSLIYKKKRKEILTLFLERNRIYSHDYFYDKFEQTARKNLSNTIKNL